MQTRTVQGSCHPITSLPLTLHVYQITFSTVSILHPFFGSSLSGPASSSSIGAGTLLSLIPVSNTHQDGNTARVYFTQSQRFLHSFLPIESPLFQKKTCSSSERKTYNQQAPSQNSGKPLETSSVRVPLTSDSAPWGSSSALSI